MRVRLLTLPILAAIAVATSGCWMLHRVAPISEATTAPTTARVPVPVPSETACLRGEYQLVATKAQPVTGPILDETRTIIENRLNATGVTGLVVRTQGGDRLTVELSTGTDQRQIRNLVGRTGHIDFVPVPAAFADAVVQGAPLPAGMDATPMFSGDQIQTARPATDQTGRPAIDVELTPKGATIFDDFAAKNFTGGNGGVRFAIVLDGIVQSALGLNTDHFGGSAQITGNFGAEEVNTLVTVLRSGALPTSLREVSFTEVTCSTGG
jgi:protein-export membrane protein SecD